MVRFNGGILKGSGGFTQIRRPTITNFSISNRTYSNDLSFDLLAPTSNSGGAFSYRSNDESICTISGDRIVVVGAGTVYITAIQRLFLPDFIYGSIDASFTVTPISPTLTNVVDISKNFEYNGSFSLLDPSSNSLGGFSYSSSDESIAKIVYKTVYYKNAGTVVITATQAANGGYTSKDVSFNFSVVSVKPTLSNFSISSQPFSLNGVVQLNPPSSDSIGAFSYTSGNITVATVSGDTLIIKKTGTSIITANQATYLGYTAADISNSFVVTASSPTIGDYAINGANSVTYSPSGTIVISNPVTNSDGAITYTSSNTSILAVSGNTLTMNGAGKVNVRYAQSASGDYTAVTVDVSFTILQRPPTLSGFADISKIYGNAPFSLTAPVSDSSGAFSYSSSNTSIASISGSTVTISAAGVVVITASQAATTNYTTATKPLTLTIATAMPSIGVLTIPNANYIAGKTFTVTNPTQTSNSPFVYSSSNTDVVSFVGNVMKYNGPGTAIITATQYANDKYSQGSVATTVTLFTNATITNFSIPSATYSIGGTTTFVDPSSNSGGAFTYTSGDTSIATVSGKTITIVSAGNVAIRGNQAANSFYNTTNFVAYYVINKATPTINGFNNIDVSFVNDLSLVITNPTSNSPGSFIFESNNPSVATIIGNKLYVKDVGNTVVTATQQESTTFLAGSPVTATYSIKAVAPTIVYSIPSITLVYNGTFQLSNPAAFPNETFTYISGNTQIADVTSSGLVTMYKAGTVNITATLVPTYRFLTNSVTTSLTINQMPATITFSIPSIPFVDSSAITIPPPTSNSTGGFLYNSTNNLVATVSGYTLIMKGAGSTVLTATQTASGDFLITSKSTTFTITKGTPTRSYTIPDVSFIYNSVTQIPSSQVPLPLSNSNGNFIYSSTNESVATSTLNGLLTIRDVGTTSIQVYQYESNNYLSGYVSGTLNVVPGPSSINAFSLPDVLFVYNGTVTLPADVTSPLSVGAITFTSGNNLIGTISGNTLTMLKSGYLKITANQAATAKYAASTYTATLFISSGPPVITYTIPAQNFVLNGTYTLPLPTSTSTSAFTYSSGNTSVATVSGNVVTIKQSGNVTIQVSQSASGDFLAGSFSTVLTINKATPSITNFVIPDASFVYNGTLVLTNPTTNSNGVFSYTSGNTSIATVTNAGLVTIKNTGTVTITANISEGDNYAASSATANLNITTGLPTIINVPISTTFVKNGTYSIPSLNSTSNGNVAYTSGNNSIATISGNVATLLKAGTLPILATQEASGNYVGGSATLLLTINKGTPTITNFNTISLAYVSDSSYAIVDPSSNSTGLFTYSSGNASIATISNNRITPVGVGSTTITLGQAFDNDYTVGTASATLSIVQGTPVITDFEIDTLVFSNGGTYTILDPVSTSDGRFTYTSGDSSIATVNGNVITMVSAGDAVITVNQEASGNYTSGSTTTTVSIKPEGTVLSNPTLSNFTITSQPFVSNAVFSLTPPTTNSTGAFKYASGNTSVARIKGGKVTILSAGTVNIRATQLAYNTYGRGIIDASLSITNASPTLLFNNFAKPFVSNGTFVFDISSNSQGAISFSSGNLSVCTVSGYTATMVSAGSAVITATQGAFGNYLSSVVTATVTFKTSTAQILNRFSDFNRVGGNDISLNGNVLCSVFDKSNNSVYYGGSFNALSYFSNSVAVYNTNADKLTYLDASNNAETNGSVFCSAYDKTNQVLYIGGSFTVVYDTSNGSMSANNIAKWNCATNSWSVLGDNVNSNGTNGVVKSIVVDNNSNVHIGGRFSTVYKSPQSITTNTPNNYTNTSVLSATNYSIWNNSINGWYNYTIGNLNTTVNALAYDSFNNYVYIGTNNIFSINSQDFGYIGRLALNTNTWTTLGNGNNGVNNTINTLCVDNSYNLYVGGTFTGYYNSSSTLTPSIGVAKYLRSTNQWSNVNGNGLGLSTYSVNAIACDGSNNVYIGGDIPTIYSGASLLSCNNIAKFDIVENSWKVLGSNTNNGTNRNVLALQFNTSLQRLYVGGSFTTVYDGSLKTKPYGYAATWNTATSSWVNLMEKNNTQFSNTVNTFVLDTYSSKLFVGGTFASFSQSVNNVLRYDLSSALMFPLGVDLSNGASGTVSAMALDTSNNLYVGGSFASVYDGSAGTLTANNLARWSITNRFWTLFGFGTTPSDNINTIVYDNSFNSVYVGGTVTSVNGLSVNNVAKYSVASSSWSSLGNSLYNGTNGTVRAMVLDNSKNLFIGGAFTTFSNSSSTPTTTNKIAKYTVATNQWSIVGSGLTNGNVKALSYDTTNRFLYAGGDFTSATDVSGITYCNNIAYWNVDTSRWSTLGNTTSASSNGTNGAVNAILCDNSNQLVYVGGEFNKAKSYNNGDVSANRVAIWNNSTSVWNVIGNSVNGFDAAVNTIAFDASKNIALFGGNFVFASDASFNNNPASKIAYAYYNTNGYILPLTISSFMLPTVQYNANYGLNYSHSYTFASTTINGNSILNLVTNNYDLSGTNDSGTITLVAGP